MTARNRRGRHPILVLAGVAAGLTVAGTATGMALGAIGSDGPGPGGPGHHRHGPPIPGPEPNGPGADRLVPPDQD